MNIKKQLRSIYSYNFFGDFILIYPLYAVMFLDSGLSPFQISILYVTWSGIVFILEIPTGVLGDLYSRKNILFWSQLVRTLGYLTWILFPTFWGFLVGFIFWGIKSALTSGTLDALIYESLKTHQREREYPKILGLMNSLSLTAILLASFLASGAIILGYKFVLIMSMVSLVVSSFSISFVEETILVKKDIPNNYVSILFEGIKYSYQNKTVFSAIIFISIFIALTGGLDEFWPIFSRNAGLPDCALGIYLGFLSGIQALGSLSAHYFNHILKSTQLYLCILCGILLYFSALLMNYYSLVILCVFSLIVAIMNVVLEANLQSIVPSEMRATLTSVKGFYMEIAVIFVYLGFGLSSQYWNYQIGFVCFGIIISIFGLLFMLIGHNN